MSGTGGFIREQIGRMEAKLDNILERFSETKQEIADIKLDVKNARDEGTKEREAIWSELRNIKHDARNEAQVMSMRIEKQETAITEMKTSIKNMDVPLQSVVTFQRRVSAIIAFAISLGSVLWVIRDPLWISLQWLAKFATGNLPK